MTDDTERKRRMAKAAHLKPHQFQPGVPSANPSGRPLGARNKLGERFLEDLHRDWQEHGAQVIETVRENDPSTYLKVVAGLMPRDLTLNVGLSDQLGAMLEQMQENASNVTHDVTHDEVINGKARIINGLDEDST